MFRFLFITLVLIFPLQNMASDSYVVNIAVYKNVDSMQKELNKLSPLLRNTIIVEKRGEEHVVCSLQTEDKKTLENLLPSYKKVFPNAFISTYKKGETPQKQIKQSLAHSRKISDPFKEDITLIDRIKQKTLYLCAYGEEVWSPNVLMEVAFFDKEVIYTPIMGEVPGKRENYTIQDNKIHISHKGIFDSETYHTLDSVTEQYYLISTWIGKRKTTTLRYYFDLENAKAYVTSLK